MIFIDSREKFNLKLESDYDLKDINLKSIGLNKFKNENIYLFESKEYKLLNYIIKPKMLFNIDLKDNLYKIIKDIDLNVQINISKKNMLFNIERYISIRIEKKISFLKFLPDSIIYEILKNTLKEITKRFDKRLKQKIISF